MTDLPRVSAPANRALRDAGYESLESLSGVGERGLLSLHGFGPKGIGILNEALAEAGLPLLAAGR